MISGTPLEWARVLDVGPDDLPDKLGSLARTAGALEDLIVRLRTLFHGCPDEELETGLMRLERQMVISREHIGDLHRCMRRELS